MPETAVRSAHYRPFSPVAAAAQGGGDTMNSTCQGNAAPQRPGISASMLAVARISHVTADEARAQVGYAYPGTLLPYYTRSGEPVMVNGVHFARLRQDQPSAAKYLSPVGAGCQLYEPPGLLDLLVPGCVLSVVEGEFKALALVEAGFACVGIGGICSACPRNAAGEPALLPALSSLIAEVRPHKLAFIGDADTCLMSDFAREAVKIAALVNLPVVLPRIPLDAPGNGPDDLRQRWGDTFTTQWQSILDTAEPVTGDTKQSALSVRLLRREAGAFAKLGPDALDKARSRLVKLAVAYKDDPLALNEIVTIAASAAELGKQTFRSAIREESKHQSASAAEARNGEAFRELTLSLAAHPIYFDGGAYWRREDGGAYGKLCREDARLHLGIGGLSFYPTGGEPSPADHALHQIQTKFRVDYAGPVCGRPPGLHHENGLKVLVTRGPVLIQPKPGECPTITGMLANLFGRAAGDSLAHMIRVYHVRSTR